MLKTCMFLINISLVFNSIKSVVLAGSGSNKKIVFPILQDYASTNTNMRSNISTMLYRQNIIIRYILFQRLAVLAV